MRKVYHLLMLLVLATLGISTSQAQKRYTVIDMSESLSIEEFADQQFVIQNGSLGETTKDFVNGLEKSSIITDDNLFCVEQAGENADGNVTYRLKRVVDGTYVSNNNGKLVYVEAASRAWTFYPVEASLATTDEVDATEPTISDFRPITTGQCVENTLVLVDATSDPTKSSTWRFCPNGEGSAPSFSKTNYATNTVLFYTVEELTGYEYLETCLDELFSNGEPSELYNSGDQPGCVPTAIYDELIEAYAAARQLIADASTDDAACKAALERCEKAYQNAKDNVVQVAEGYYYFRSARGENSVTYEDGANLRWVEDWSEKETLETGDAKYIWQLIENPKKKGSYFIKNVFSGRYVGVPSALYTLVPTTAEAEESFLIYPISKEYFVIQSVSLVEKPFSAGYDCIHAQVSGHSTVIWSGQPASIQGSGWKFLHVDDEKIDAIRDQLAQAQRNDALEKALESAKADYANGFSYKFDGYTSGKLDNNDDGTPMGLLTDVSKITTNAQEASEGPISQILDSNIGSGNFFHSSWSADNFDHTNNYPYLQIDLGKSVNAIAVKMWPRINGTTVMTNNLPGKIHVVCTNTPEDETSWVEIGTFENALTWPTVTTNDAGEEVTSASNDVAYLRVPFGETAYQYVRLEVATRLGSTTDFKTVAVSTGCFNLAEIRVFESYYDEASSLNNAIPTDVMKNFTEAMEKAEAELATESATQATIDELAKAHADYLANFPDPQRVLNALTTFKAKVNAAFEGTDVCYFAEGAKASATEAIAAIEANVKDVMTVDEVNAQLAAITDAMKAFFAKINMPADGSYVYLVSKTSGAASEAYVYSAGNNAAKNRWAKADEYLQNRPEFVWQFIKKADGTYSLRNAANGQYLNTPRLGGSKGAGMSTEGDTCSFSIENDLAVEGAINLATAQGVYVNADPSGPVVTWGAAGGKDNSTFAFVEVDAENAYNGEYGMEVNANGFTVRTLPISVLADENCYSVIGRNGSYVELEQLDGTIEAGTPFIYKNDGEETIAVLISKESTIAELVYATEAKEVNGLQGTLAPVDSVHVNYGILYEGNTIVDAMEGDGVLSNTGYFLPTMPTTDATGDAHISIDGKIDAIGNVTTEAEPAVVNVYTLAGVKVRTNVKAANAVSNLPAGIYIVGNKKVLVK